MFRPLACALLVTVPAALATADYRVPAEGPIATDRPGNGNAASSISRGHLQLEWGALYARPSGASDHQLSFPLMLRFGLLDRLELRAGSALLGVGRTASNVDVSATDTSVGLKAAALHEHGARPDLAFSADVYLPTGAGAFTAGVVQPEVRALAAWSLPRGVSVLTNLGADVPENGAGARYPRFVEVLNLAYAPPQLDGRLSVFVETFGRHAVGAGSDQIVQVDWGASGRLGQDMQIDFYVQHGLTDDAPHLQLSLGYSVRL